MKKKYDVGFCWVAGGLLGTFTVVGLIAFLWLTVGHAFAEHRGALDLQVEERARPLVEAIHLYEDERGAPPTSLWQLMPEYIDEVPEAPGTRHEYTYETSDSWSAHQRPLRPGQAWELRFTCHTGLGSAYYARYRPTPAQDVGVDTPRGEWAHPNADKEYGF